MKKFFLISILSLVCNISWAGSTKQKLFKVSSPAGDSYVLGTMHAGIDLQIDFDTNVKKLIEDSRVILPEMDMTSEQLKLYKTEPYKAMMQTTPLSGTGNLDSITKQKLMELGMPDYLVDRLSDNTCMALQAVLLAKPEMPTLDYQVIELAHNKDIPVISLDSMELRQQARQKSDAVVGTCSLRQVFTDYTPEQIKTSLEQSLMDDVIFYHSGENEAEETLNMPIVTVRNHAWMKTIEEEIKKGKAFIAVGNAHLPGREGILQLLKDRGYQVELVE